MRNLLEEYFKRDLFEAEEEQLAQWLVSSPEGTQLLINKMETHYRRLGAREPDWVERPLPDFFPKAGGHFHKLWFWALLALVLAWGGRSAYRWMWEKETPGERLPSVNTTNTNVEKTPGSSLRQPSTIPSGKRKLSPARQSAASNPKFPRPRGGPSKSPTVQQRISVSSSSALSPSLPRTPGARANIPANRNRYEELSVVVDTGKAELVTVRVLDPAGRQIRLLFAGILPIGQRTFTWDGKASDGRLAPAGTYSLEVTSGTNVQGKEVHLMP